MKRATKRATAKTPSKNGAWPKKIPISDEQAATLLTLQQQVDVLQGRLGVYGEAIAAGHGITGRFRLVGVGDGKQKTLILDQVPKGT